MTQEPQANELRRRLLRAARRLVADPNEAEDLVQECLLALDAHAHGIRNRAKVLRWCRAVLRNVYRQRLRRRWYTEVRGTDDRPERVTDPWDSVDASLVVEGALAALAPRTQRVMRDFYLVGHSIAAISAQESRPVGTIKRWLHEGREALRMALCEMREDAPLARVYASDWLDDTKRNVTQALVEAGYRPEFCELAEDESLATDAALHVFGQQAGARSGLELLLALRASEGGASRPVLLFGPGRPTAMLAAWQAGADCYLTDPSSPELARFVRWVRDGGGPWPSSSPPSPEAQRELDKVRGRLEDVVESLKRRDEDV